MAPRRQRSLTASALVGVVALLVVSGLAAVGVAERSPDGGSTVVALSGAGGDGTAVATGGRGAGGAGGTAAGTGTGTGGGRRARAGANDRGGDDAADPPAATAAPPSAAEGSPPADGADAAEGIVAPGDAGVAGASSGTAVPEGEPAAPPPAGISTVATAVDAVWFGTVRWVAGAACPRTELWRVVRPVPGREAIVAATAGLDRVVELDPATGAVLAVLATWDAERHVPVGRGVSAIGGGVEPAVSADGRNLAYGARRAPSGDTSVHACSPDVVVRDLATGRERVFEASAGSETEDGRRIVLDTVRGLRWSPDGTKLAVTRSYEGDWTSLLDLAAHRSLEDAPSVVPAEGWSPDSADWLHDGRLILTSSCCYPEHVQRGTLATVGTDGIPQPVAEGQDGARGVAVDPTGHHVAHLADGDSVVVRRDLGAPVVLATGYADLDW